MNIRLATLDDVPTLIQVRLDFDDLWHPHSDDVKAAHGRQLEGYFTKGIEAGWFFGYLGYVDGEVATVAFMEIKDCAANCSRPHGRQGYLYNVLTYPQYRKQGFAEQVVVAAINQAKTLGADVIDLDATDMGQPLYEKLGFHIREYTPMRLAL